MSAEKEKLILQRANQRVQDVLAIKIRQDELRNWFEKQKAITREQAQDSPEISRGFYLYESALAKFGDNWFGLVPHLERLQILLQKALQEYKITGEAIEKLSAVLAPRENDRRFEYINFRRKRLEAQYLHGYSVTLAEIEKWIEEVVKLDKQIAEEEAAQKLDSINEYLESQVSRFEETMTVADFKKLQNLTQKIDDPSSRQALWNLLREYEEKHATVLEMLVLDKPRKPKLSTEQARDGWEVLTRVAEADDPEARRDVLDDMRAALRKKQGKRAREGLVATLAKARRLGTEDES